VTSPDDDQTPPDRVVPPPGEDGGRAVAGTVAIVGRPNVGKSTLLNRLVGEKLAIVSPRPQTTRNRIIGVWNGRLGPQGMIGPVGGQIVFVDTPGVHAAGRSELNRFMLREALAAISEVDAVLMVVEAPERGSAAGLPAGARGLPRAEQQILEHVQEAKRPVILAINKVDRLRDKPALFPVLTAWQERAPFAALVPVSATQAVGLEGLLRELLALLPEGPPLYDADTLTDRSERFLASELIREQLFLRLRQELPYATAVVIDGWQERAAQGDVVVEATILVERESQKGIVVGNGGQMIRDVGAAARAEVTRLLGRPAHLKLQVKVAPEWTSSSASLARLGYERGG
jgi:GTP-binding protein Era